MFCSTIIPTINRVTLSRSVESVLNQNFFEDEFEVIVVNDSGRPLPTADWHHSNRVKIIHTNRHNRSVARNSGAAIATGKYLHFLDDDDWLRPGAFDAFWELAQKNRQTAWLYGGFCLVDNLGNHLREISPEETNNCYVQLIASEWIPLQTSIIKSEVFFSVGGFAPLSSLLGGYEDIDLSRQVVYRHEMAAIPAIIANIRIGDSSSTTNYQSLFLQNRQSREKALNASGSFSRMQASAQASKTDSEYWHGQIVYYYLASLNWNLRQKRFFTAVSRGIYSLGAFVAARKAIFSSSFWQGMTKPHINRVRKATEETDLALYSQTIWKP